ncbi:MAG TPA: calcium-binding protein [Rhizomicrobium sp.]|jgi:Ca2+-binding RTX toxin-like protein
MTIKGTAGDDILTGTAAADSFNMAQGGDDTVSGLGGNDVFLYGATFNAADHIDGGDGIDTLDLDGDYSTDTVFEPNTLVNVEKITLSAGHDYYLQMNDATVAAGQNLQVNASALGAGNTLTFFGNSETDGSLTVTGGAGDDNISGGKFHNDLYGGAGDDTIYVNGGVNTVEGGDGNDTIRIEGAFSSTSKFDGGAGSNQIFFDGNDPNVQILGRNSAINIADIGLGGGSYKLSLGNGIVAANHLLAIYGNGLTSTETASISAVHLTAGNVYLQGGAGTDKLVGGDGNDGFEGRGGHDVLTGGPGANSFYYGPASDSTSITFDRITDFNASVDHIFFGSGVNAIDTAVNGGTVTGSKFDAQLTSILDASHLAAHDAVLFTPSVGYLAGHTLLVVDANGTPGYQASADYVVDITGMTGTLTMSSF